MTKKLLQTIQSWVDKLPPVLAPTPEVADTDVTDLVVVHPGPVLFWLLSRLPVWEEVTREEAAQFVLEREVRVRYRPLIVEMDRKTILNEVT